MNGSDIGYSFLSAGSELLLTNALSGMFATSFSQVQAQCLAIWAENYAILGVKYFGTLLSTPVHSLFGTRGREATIGTATHFNTQNVAQREKFSFWREAVCDAYVHLGCNAPNPDRFDGEIVLYRMPSVSVSFVSGSQQEVRRRKRDIMRASEASFLISMQMKQTALIEQSGRMANLKPGDFALYSSINPYALHLPDGFGQLVVQIPRQDLPRRLPNADLLTGTTVAGDGEMGSLVKDSISRLVGSIDQTNPMVRHCMEDTIVDLFATGLASLTQAGVELAAPERQTMLRAQSYLQANLQNPKLNRQMLAEAMGISVRRLGEIFRANETAISLTIRNMRLQRIASELLDQRYTRATISEIAMKWGVNNMQHFSRMFRDHFGMAPREYRRCGRLNQVN